jgi:hypothetical protein
MESSPLAARSDAVDDEHTHDRCVGVCYLDGEDIGVTWCARSSPVTARASVIAVTQRRNTKLLSR